MPVPVRPLFVQRYKRFWCEKVTVSGRNPHPAAGARWANILGQPAVQNTVFTLLESPAWQGTKFMLNTKARIVIIL
jgi:hypothetical protein